MGSGCLGEINGGRPIGVKVTHWFCEGDGGVLVWKGNKDSSKITSGEIQTRPAELAKHQKPLWCEL